MSAKKKAYNKTSNYLISMDKNNFSKNFNCLGKLRFDILLCYSIYNYFF